MLKVTKASEPMPVTTFVFTVYGTPGTGKTSLGYTADEPLLLDTDMGAYRSAFRKDTVQARSWSDIAGITAEDVAGYKTLVLDTAGRALDLLAVDIIAKNPKMGQGGALSLKGYGELKSRFIAYLNLMRSFGLDIVLIAHSDEKMQGDEIIERIDMQGASKNEVYKSADSMARLGIVGGKRVLSFSPTDTRFGKDPAGLGAVAVPDFHTDPQFLGRLIRDIKARLNTMSAQQQAGATAVMDRAAEWQAALDMCGSAGDYTSMIPLAEGVLEKKALIAHAAEKGYRFDRDAAGFVGMEPKPEPEPGDLFDADAA
jgi:hypothetical protein